MAVARRRRLPWPARLDLPPPVQRCSPWLLVAFTPSCDRFPEIQPPLAGLVPQLRPPLAGSAEEEVMRERDEPVVLVISEEDEKGFSLTEHRWKEDMDAMPVKHATPAEL